MSVALLHGSRTLGAQHRALLGWDDHTGSAITTVFLHGLVHQLFVVSPIGGKRRKVRLDVVQERRYSCGVSGLAGCKIRSDDVTCLAVDGEVDLSPGSTFRRPTGVSNMDFEAAAVDQQMDRPRAVPRQHRDLSEVSDPPRDRTVVGDR